MTRVSTHGTYLVMRMFVCVFSSFSFSSSLTLPLVPLNSIRNATPLSLPRIQQLSHFFPFSSLYYSLCPLLSSSPKVWFYLLPLLPFKWSSCPSQTVRAHVRVCVCVFYCIAVAWVCDLLCHESIWKGLAIFTRHCLTILYLKPHDFNCDVLILHTFHQIVFYGNTQQLSTIARIHMYRTFFITYSIRLF